MDCWRPLVSQPRERLQSVAETILAIADGDPSTSDYITRLAKDVYSNSTLLITVRTAIVDIRRGVYPYLPLATNAPITIFGEEFY